MPGPLTQPQTLLNLAEEKGADVGNLFNCALYQQDLDLRTELLQTLPTDNPHIHLFTDSDELIRLSQRYQLDLTLLAVTGQTDRAFRIICEAKANMSLSLVPTVVYCPEGGDELYRQALACGADDLLVGRWDPLTFGVRLKMLQIRSQRDLGLNPTSRMPGPALIAQKINGLLQQKAVFAVCYLDIDDFKSYNDYYGYYYGDKVIRLTAHIVRDIVFDLVPEGFVGHVGGDDFVFIIPVDKIDVVCTNIIKTFDRIIPYRYREEDRIRGKIVTKNRRGYEEVFPLLTLSIAVLINQNGNFSHAGEMSHMLADLKKYTKKLAGSNYMVERRKKY